MKLTDEEIENDFTEFFNDYTQEPCVEDNEPFDIFSMPSVEVKPIIAKSKENNQIILHKRKSVLRPRNSDLRTSPTSEEIRNSFNSAFPMYPTSQTIGSTATTPEVDVDIPVVSTTASDKVVASSMDSVPASDSVKSSEKVELVTLTTKLSKENVKYVKVLKATEEIKNISTFIDSLITEHRNTQKAE